MAKYSKKSQEYVEEAIHKMKQGKLKIGKSEKLVKDALEELMKNRLVIVIAHRFPTIQNADRIVVLEGGKIVDSGSPGALAEKDGIYSELLRYQIDGNQKLLEKYELQ